MGFLLLTGSTGLLGSYVLRDALLARRQVAAIVRPRARQTGRERLEALLQFWEAELGRRLPRPVVVEGNLHDPQLGVSDADRRWIAEHCDQALHGAARVSFETDDVAGEPERTNLGGTQHMLELCQAAGIRRYCQISTAYVAGRRRGVIRESDAAGVEGFCNDYERTKAEAEAAVQSARFLDVATILRPSIIVGDSRTGFAPAFHGIYTPLRLGYLHLLGKLREGWQLDLELVQSVVEGQFIDRLGLTGNERKNLVPVDWVSQAALAALDDPSAAGRVLHLAHTEPTTIGALAVAMVDAALASLENETEHRAGIPPALMEAEGFQEHMQVYRDHLADDPQFDCAALAGVNGAGTCPPLDHDALVRLWRWAIDADFSWRPPQPTPPQLDVAARLAPLPDPAANASLALEVTGPGGGGWLVEFAGDAPIAAGAAACKNLPRIAVSAETLSEIAAHRLQLEDAVSTGRLVAVGPSAREAVFTHMPLLINWLARTEPPALIATTPRPV